MELINNALSVDVSIEFRLSFQPFVTFLNAQRSQASSMGMYDFYTHLVDQFTPALALDSPADQLSSSQLEEFFQLTTMAVMPLTSNSQTVPFAFGLPSPMTMFYQSAAFSQLIRQYPGLLARLPEKISPLDRQRFVYRLILEKCYGVSTSHPPNLSLRFQHELNGLTRYYRIDINLSFIEPHTTLTLPPLQQAWIDFANGTSPTVPTINPLPIANFTFDGFAFFQVEDITETETILQLQNVFAHLQSDTEAVVYQRFETALRNVCGQSDLQISLTALPQVNGYFVNPPVSQSRSIFLRYAGINLENYRDPVAQAIAKKLMQQPTSHVFPGLEGMPDEPRQILHQRGIRSFLLYPITTTAGEMLGILEMGSPRADAFNSGVLSSIERIIPLVQEFLRYQLNQINDSLERLVKTQFTSLQPAVAWKFYEVAWELLSRGQKPPGQSGTALVNFPQVYPLYGAVDIRDSSVKRHKAVRQDLANQLIMVDQIAGRMRPPLDAAPLDRIIAQNNRWQTTVRNGLKPDDELEIAHFLTKEVNPYFRQLLPQQSEDEISLQYYFNQTNPQTGQFDRALKAYERSVAWINATINDYIDEEERQLQATYPHYFERYRTDGMEYTIYVGQSITPDLVFERNYRSSLSSWQLTSMVLMARLTHRLLPLLPLPLQTTQLILAHAHPVDISFRQDERRFDVEGSYSIRYEVLKKRIDKAYIDGKHERLTQPDTIALVYTHHAELTDYLPAIASLQEQEMLLPGVEYLDLEPLQGVVNLKALRLRVKYPD